MNKKSLISSILNDPSVIRHRRWRMLKDKLVTHGMTAGGISVIGAIVLIFFYLLYVVFPLLLPAQIKKVQQFTLPLPSAGKSLYLATEEKGEMGIRLTDQAHVIFFQTKDGTVISDIPLVPFGTKVTSFAVADSASGVVAVGLENGRAIVIKSVYDISYPNDIRVVQPRIEYPLGKEPIVVDERGQALLFLDLQLGEENTLLVGVTRDNRLVLSHLTRQTSFIDESVTLERTVGELSLPQAKITHLLLEKEQKKLYATDRDGYIWYIDLIEPTQPKIVQRMHVIDEGHDDNHIVSLEFLTSDISLLLGDSRGKISQWFLVRDENNNQVLKKVREFYSQQASIVAIVPEERRKGFVAADALGYVGIYHTSAYRTILVTSITKNRITQLGLSPRADTLVVEDDQGELQILEINNVHPEVSWSALWNKVWYESHEKPKFIWQSSSASSDFEPKFSLTPLAFGTLKSAFYAMLIAIPLAILGAVYTAYFMSPRIRKLVKPTIEIMAALPTVILGFLAGLWLAPAMEEHLPGVFMVLFFMPLGVLSAAWAWHCMPTWLVYRVPEGWQAVLLIPVVLLVGIVSFALSPWIEAWLFEGNLPLWLTNTWGITFDQRNALVVGVAMGLAVIPNIFSIAEDAVFSVPKHLTVGSLALGATPWQTMTRIVILTASPGIFSAVMIGMGRAIGETMIVLMATGNTPVMDFSMFQGLRTLAANIAVEMPESEVNSTHFRILFLSGLVLFIFTFFFNTLAEVVRQRLRKKYSSL